MADDGFWVGDHLPITTLSYALGPGFVNHLASTGRLERIDPSLLDRSPRDFAFPATVPAERETHGGDDVSVYASGPWSHLFGGVAEQSVLAHLVRFATCMGVENVESDAGALNACSVGLDTMF